MSACYIPSPESIGTDYFAGPEAYAARIRAAMAGNPAPYLVSRRYFGREAFRPLAAPVRPSTARPIPAITAPAPRVPYLRPWPPVRPAAFVARYPQFKGLEGFEGFLSKIKKAVKKVGKGVAKVAKKTVKAVSNAVRSVGRFARKNWKWVVLAAAAAFTIYYFGPAIASKLNAGYLKLKGYTVAAGKWTAAKAKTCMDGMKKLLGGKKVGELQPSEVEAMGEVNEVTGQTIVPPEILKCFGKQALTLAEEAAQAPAQAAPVEVEPEPEEAPEAPATRTRNKPDKEKKDLPKWVLPAAAAAGGLALALVLGK